MNGLVMVIHSPFLFMKTYLIYEYGKKKSWVAFIKSEETPVAYLFALLHSVVTA